MSDSNETTAEIRDSSAHNLPVEVFEPGQMLGGKYKLVSLIGAGGMGAVYKVEQVFLRREFALKTLNTNQTSDIAMRRFQMEARATSLLRHANLVQVHDFGLLDDGRPYLVMDYVDGITLAQYLKEKAPLAIDEAVKIVMQACEGLAYAHEQKIVHRDIKPSNIMLLNKTDISTSGSIKVLDFGIAKLTSHEEGEIQALTRTGEIFGSPLYMSPEQCSGAAVDQRSDIYSLGCVLFEALTGVPPHMGHNSLTTMLRHQSERAPTLKEASLGREFPSGLEQILARMLTKAPDDRYADLSSVSRDLSSVVHNTGIIQQSPKKPAKTPPRVVSIAAGKFYSLLAGVILVSASIAGIAGYHFNQNETRPQFFVTPILPAQKVNDKTLITSDGEDDYQKFAQGEGMSVKMSGQEFMKVTRISSKLVSQNGVQSRQISFPSHAIGRLWIHQSPYQTDFCSAANVITLPVGEPLTLVVSSRDTCDALKFPDLFKKIDPNIFYGLDITNESSDLEDSKSSSPAAMARNIAAVLRTATTWTNLNYLDLHYVNVGGTVFESLNHMRHLRVLELLTPYGDCSGLSNVSTLDHLEFLALREIKVHGMLRQLTRSPDLQSLMLEGTDARPEELQALNKCSKLINLDFNDGKIVKTENLLAIMQLKKLRTLAFRNCAVSPQQVTLLSKCGWLKQITLSRGFYSAVRQTELKSLDSRIGFFSEKLKS